MKNKKWVAVIISFLVIVSLIGVLSSLLGFRLAEKNGATMAEPDRLVGFLVTTESLNLDIYKMTQITINSDYMQQSIK